MYSKIINKLSRYQKKNKSHPDLRPASVLVPIFEQAGELKLLYTRRTEKVEHHKGQISFPGGMRDPSDRDPAYTALRETWEEVGIRTSDIEIIGELDDHVTVTGFNVTPFVGRIPFPFQVKICEEELSEVFSVPLSFLMDPDNCTTDFLRDDDGKERNFYVFQYGSYRIWGATAEITRNFIQVIN